MNEVLPSPMAEIATTPETELQQRITPAVSRGMFSAVDKKFFHPDQKSPTTDEAAALAQKNEKDIPYRALAKLSLDSRADYYKNSDKTFAQQNKDWNTETATWIKNGAAKLTPDELHLRNEALKSLGITVEDQAFWQENTYEFKAQNADSSESVMLVSGVEEFRKRYLQKHSEVEKFVTDIANGCRPQPDQPVDIALLEKRLHAVSGLITSFGESHAVDKLVHNFAISHGLLTQTESDKTALSQTAAQQLGETLPADLHKGFEALAAKQDEIDTAAITEEQAKQKKDEEEDQKIKDAIEQAKKTAKDTAEWNAIQAAEEDILKRFNRGEISASQRNAELGNLEKKRGGIMKFENSTQFKRALEILNVPEYEVNRFIEHENDHFEAARQYNLNPLFEVQLSLEVDGKITPHATTIYNQPTGVSDAENREINKNILLAPGILAISKTDAIGAGLDWEDVLKTHQVFAPNTIGHDFVEGIEPNAKKVIGNATFDHIRKNRQEIAELYKTHTLAQTSEDPTPAPSSDASPELMSHEYLRAAIAAAGAPESLYDQLKDDNEFKIIIDTFTHGGEEGQKEGLFGDGFPMLQRFIAEKIGKNSSLKQSTSLSEILKAHENGASIILPIGKNHAGLFESGPDTVKKTQQNDLLLTVRDTATNNTVQVSLNSLLSSNIMFLQGLRTASPMVASDDAEEQFLHMSPAFIIEKIP